ncbi:MAG: shikimate kinase [Staphylococcus epidermidis]|nr:shikimate kinase [Staphylococcus epidermidis]
MKSIQVPIILVGFMGTGKTTVGKYLSDLYNLSYVDLDNFIEVNECKSIPDIFIDIGEKGFRSLETKYLKACLNTFDIISTGGGIIEDTNSLKLLKSQKHVVWLDCDIEIIFKRVKNDPHRPNAKSKNLNQLDALYSSRLSRYNEIAFMKVDSAQSVSEICTLIETKLLSD